jgi:acyl-CoA thioesterase-1
MKKLLLLLLMVFSSHSQAQSPVILVLGDSLSAAYGIDQESGWVSLLQQRLEQQGFPHQVVNASISGDTTFGGINRLSGALERFKPSIVLIELGANDGLRGLGLDQTRRNLVAMVDQVRQADSQAVLLGIMLPPNFGKAFTQRFIRIYHEVSEQKSVTLVPFLLEGVADRMEWMQSDGLHPNASGQPRILDNVWMVLEPLLITPESGQASG